MKGLGVQEIKKKQKTTLQEVERVLASAQRTLKKHHDRLSFFFCFKSNLGVNLQT